MAGIYGVFVMNKSVLDTIPPLYRYFHSYSFPHIHNEQNIYDNFLYGRSVLNNSSDTRTMEEDEDVVIAIEGIVYDYDNKEIFSKLKSYYFDEGIRSIRELKGQFCGFIFDKRAQKLYLFNDHLNTKPLYIYNDKEYLIFASELKVVTSTMAYLGIKKELNYDAVYSMLTFGYMINNVTYEKNCRKLAYASVLEVDKTLSGKTRSYFKYRKRVNEKYKKDDIIEEIDRLVVKSVERVWKKDFSDTHYAFLSGGLDSRVNILLAKELGFGPILGLTFAQSKSSDHMIANAICSTEGFEHLFYALDNGIVLEKNLKTFCAANDGLAILTGSASGYSLLEIIAHEKFDILHTGQIGDILFGSYTKKSFSVNNAIMSDRKDLLSRISFYDDFRKKFADNAEIFGLEERAMHATLNGDRTTAHFVDMVSPFYDRELIEFCLNIPDKYKKNEAIYIEWFNRKHPQISKYPWESAGVKPRTVWNVTMARQYKKLKNALLRRLGVKINDMNPFDIWIKTNAKITKNLDQVFFGLIDRVYDDTLRALLKTMYLKKAGHSHYGRYNKFLVVTLLLALELHFEDDVR